MFKVSFRTRTGGQRHHLVTDDPFGLMDRLMGLASALVVLAITETVL